MFQMANVIAFAASPLNSVAPNEKKKILHPGYASSYLYKITVLASALVTIEKNTCKVLTTIYHNFR